MAAAPAYNNYGVKDPDPFSEIDLDSGPNQCKLLLDFHLLSSSCTWIVGMCIYYLAEPINFVLLRLIDTSIGSELQRVPDPQHWLYTFAQKLALWTNGSPLSRMATRLEPGH